MQGSVRSLPGVGPKKEKALAALGIEQVGDALRVYPRDYEDRTVITPIGELEDGQKACICAVVGTQPVLRHIRKGLDLTKVTAFDETGTVAITFFNNKFAAASLKQGQAYLFYGRVQLDGRHIAMSAPAYERCDGDNPQGRIVPVYPLSDGLTQKDLLRVTDAALAYAGEDTLHDVLPEEIRARCGLDEFSDCLRQIHRPQNMAQVQKARRRIIFEELFLLCCGLSRLRERRQSEEGIVFAETDLAPFWKALPFAPTGAQRRAAETIARDVCSGRPMNRLVQGDVGSGKTAVAAALCVLAAQNGYQAALMAPTELLAAQHAATLSAMLGPCGLSCVLLSGAMGAKDRREALAAIEEGRAQVVIGTHALIQKGVSFHNLGAVIVDEQHRFGVGQRAALTAKGQTPHVLVMSATPIPRTLALILYGDLDVSVLDELPPGRTAVETYAVGESMRPRIEKFIDKQCAEGGQVYVVCPLVEEGENGLKSAEQHGETLRTRLPARRVGLLHGRMRPAEKEAVMAQFASGTLDILVATTVIEVGVDVPNANLMVVEDADRFGLSQLHQLRGRVGRGARASYCIFFGADRGQNAKDRLQILCGTNDGFAIAKADLAHRGPGDFFGSRQHGLPPLHVADLAGDMEVLAQAQAEAADLLSRDPALTEYPLLRGAVSKLFRGAREGDIFN